MSKIITYPPAFLEKLKTSSGCEADADIAAHLAGMNHWLYGHASGDSVDGEFVGHRDPSGVNGHPHSGPPYGVALQHSTGVLSSHTSSGIYGSGHTIYATPGLRLEVKGLTRPHIAFDGAPYSRLYLGVWIMSLAGTPSVEINWRPRNGQWGTPQTLSSIGSTIPTSKTLALNLYMDTESGEIDEYEVFMKPTTAVDCVLLAATTMQIATRSH